MEVKVTFFYQDKKIQIVCKESDKMENMFQQFINELKDGSQKEHYIYYCGVHKLGHESTIKDNKYLSYKKEIDITVQRKLRIIKCPKCICNDCIINLNNYIASFYGCKNKHSFNQVYDQYINLQKIDGDEIKCTDSSCENTQQNYNKGFYKCLDCSEITDHSKYFCKDHIDNHKDHKYIKYDKKNYYCEKHFKFFIKYCFTHNQNLCEDCEKEHKKDKIANYQAMTPDIEKLKESLNIMGKNIAKLKIIIDDIKSRLEDTLRVFKRYHYIAKDIIGKFELFNQDTDLKNNKILRSLWNLQSSNKKMNDDLANLIKGKDFVQKVKNMISIYQQKEDNYKNNTSDTNVKIDQKKEDDEWWEEIKNDINKNEKGDGKGKLEKHKTKSQNQ